MYQQGQTATAISSMIHGAKVGGGDGVSEGWIHGQRMNLQNITI